MTETNNQSSIIHHQSKPASGRDLDVWGGFLETRACAIPVPGTDAACILKDDGECPDGCRACADFAEEMEQLPAHAPRGLSQETEDTDE
jgi:hypothetical protein